MDDTVRSKLEQMASGSGRDFDALSDIYEDKLAEVEERTPDTMGEEQVRSIAVSQVGADVTKDQSVGRSGNNVKIVSLGYRGFIQMGDDNEDVLVTYGVVDPEDQPRQVGVILNEESTGADLYGIQEAFEPLNVLEAEYSVDVANNLQDTYVLHATANTEPEVLDSDMSVEERRSWIADKFLDDRATLAEVGQYISKGGRDGYPDLFGADLQRIQGTVVDWHITDDGETGVYTLQDDSIVDPNDYGNEITGGDDNGRTPGLTAWTDPSLMEYGENSVCDFYGAVSVMNDGQVVMNVVGIAPIMANDLEYDGGGSSGSSTSDDAEERTI